MGMEPSPPKSHPFSASEERAPLSHYAFLSSSHKQNGHKYSKMQQVPTSTLATYSNERSTVGKYCHFGGRWRNGSAL